VTVVVSMPFYGCHRWLRQSVDSILAQTYRDLLLVVVNDADPEPPWPLLADIDDPRLIRFDMPENRGRYFADAVIFEATRPELWAMQDPDDWAEPDRFERMVPLARKHGAAFAPTLEFPDVALLDVFPGAARALASFARSKDGQPVVTDARYREPAASRMRHHIGYGSGVISGERIALVGGFHAGLRMGFDTYLMNAVKLLGPFGLDAKPLQNKRRRPNSLTTDAETRAGSPERTRVRRLLKAMYRTAHARHVGGLEIASVVRDDIDRAVALDVDRQAERLRAQLAELAA
jgi:glycosyltransferase involved in cell wall biosynthesis